VLILNVLLVAVELKLAQVVIKDLLLTQEKLDVLLLKTQSLVAVFVLVGLLIKFIHLHNKFAI